MFNCFIVKITPPIHSFIEDELKSVSLNNNLFSGVDGTLTLSNLLVIVAVLSSAAKIPFPFPKFLMLYYLVLTFYFKAFIPGSSFPSRYSKKAPPAVETKLKSLMHLAD